MSERTGPNTPAPDCETEVVGSWLAALDEPVEEEAAAVRTAAVGFGSSLVETQPVIDVAVFAHG